MSIASKGVVLGLFALAAACGQDTSGAAARLAREAEGGRARTVLSSALHGVPRPFTGAVNAIRGVPGGGVPWVLAEGKAVLKSDGSLEVEVEGLVFDPNDAVVIARGIGGTNTVAQAKAVVSCLTVQDGAAVTVNVSSALVPFTTGAAADGGGNATIEEKLVLPSPCLAPIVFVTSPAGAWFAATGS
jgi:hypothetical protein